MYVNPEWNKLQVPCELTRQRQSGDSNPQSIGTDSYD